MRVNCLAALSSSAKAVTAALLNLAIAPIVSAAPSRLANLSKLLPSLLVALSAASKPFLSNSPTILTLISLMLPSFDLPQRAW